MDIKPDSALEKALNVTLNNPRNQGEFTENLDALLREIQVELPDLSVVVDLTGLLEIPVELDMKLPPTALPPTSKLQCPKCGFTFEGP